MNNKIVLTAITNPFNVKDTVVINQLNLIESIKYIQENSIEKVFIKKVNDLGFVTQCPSIKYIAVWNKYEFSPLYELPEVIMLQVIDNDGLGTKQSDLFIDKLRGLKMLTTEFQNIKNLESAKDLATLALFQFKNKEYNLNCLGNLTSLDTLRFVQGNIKSLSGINTLTNLQCLYLYGLRSLRDISQLKQVKNSIRLLRIENCNSIEDYSVLSELENLELLSITGNNSIDNLKFIEKLSNLKSIVLGINVLDGNLNYCDRLEYAAVLVNKKHYSHKDNQLPKGRFIRGNENIELWRRLEL